MSRSHDSAPRSTEPLLFADVMAEAYRRFLRGECKNLEEAINIAAHISHDQPAYPDFRVYVAGAGQELWRPRGAMRSLRTLVHPEVVSLDWTASVEALLEAGVPNHQVLADVAEMHWAQDREAIAASDVLWLLASPRCRDSLAELGFAQGLRAMGHRIQIVVSGEYARSLFSAQDRSMVHLCTESDHEACLRICSLAGQHAALQGGA